MTTKTLSAIWICLLAAIVSCKYSTVTSKEKKVTVPVTSEPTKGTYAYDAAFLKAHNARVVELVSRDNISKILLSADYQGRVMTSTANGD